MEDLGVDAELAFSRGESRLSRRRLLTTGVAAGGAIWAAPAIDSLVSAAGAQTGSGFPKGCTTHGCISNGFNWNGTPIDKSCYVWFSRAAHPSHERSQRAVPAHLHEPERVLSGERSVPRLHRPGPRLQHHDPPQWLIVRELPLRRECLVGRVACRRREHLLGWLLRPGRLVLRLHSSARAARRSAAHLVLRFRDPEQRLLHQLAVPSRGVHEWRQRLRIGLEQARRATLRQVRESAGDSRAGFGAMASGRKLAGLRAHRDRRLVHRWCQGRRGVQLDGLALLDGPSLLSAAVVTRTGPVAR